MSETRPNQMGRMGPWFAGIWLFFLTDPLLTGWAHRGELRGVVGIVATLSFAVVYMALWVRLRQDRTRLVADPPMSFTAPYLGGLVLLGGLMVGCLGETGLASVVYIAVATVMVFPPRLAAGVVAGLVVATLGLSAVEGWGSQVGLAFAILAASVAIFGMRTVMRRNIDLIRAEQENANLAVENERTRFARDLHDILGHSLTVITVKAELAQRLLDVDTGRARAELADLERLSRDALADVRRAVAGYRELTLPGELTRARAALAAAEIAAQLPNSADHVPSETARAVRLDGARGRDQRDPALASPHLRGAADRDQRRGARRRGGNRRGRHRYRRDGSARPARAGGRRRRDRRDP